MSRFFKPISFVVFLILPFFAAAQTPAKNRMDLDDLTIKGELHNDDRLLIISRQKNEMKNFVKFRTNYREEILQQLPKTQKKRNY